MKEIQRIINLSNGLDPKKASFTEDCFLALNEFKCELDLKSFNKELSQSILSDDFCTQLNVYNNFGQPPVTLFNNGEFVIDLYFWLYSDTSIHTHSFKGAFKVLFGESYQELFDIETVKHYSEDVRFNNILQRENKKLNQNDCQRILQGDQFCHRVIHKASPTVTLCIRTINDVDVPQWHQFDNGLSILKVELPEQIYKAIFFLQYLLEKNKNEAQPFLDKILGQFNPSLILNLFELALSGTLGLSDETLEIFQNSILKKFNGKEWFSLYLEESC